MVESSAETKHVSSRRSSKPRRALIWCLNLVGVASALLFITTSALANHPNTECDFWSGSYSNLQQIPLQIHYINWSHWYAGKDYVAIRKDIAGNETFHQYTEGTVDAQTTTSDGYDLYRRTVIQRGGYASDIGFEDEWSHLYC